MSFLAQVTKGKLTEPALVLIYGPDGVGKSTFGADAPSPIFLGAERGTAQLDVARLPRPKNFGEILGQILELGTAKHDYKTLVVDSLDWIEPLLWDAVCRESGAGNIEQVGGGYGKGYVYALNKWVLMRNQLQELREKRGMNIILIAHSLIRTFHDPATNASYDRYQVKMNEKAASMWREYVEAVLFAIQDTHTKDGDTGNKSKAYSDGSRVMYTERRPAFDAKNRMSLPFKMRLSWDDFYHFSTAKRTPAGIRSNVEQLLKEVADKDLVARVANAVVEAKDDGQKLLNIENKLKEIIGGNNG